MQTKNYKILDNKKNPLISVIVPNYNYARYLRERIDSILNQTFSDFELILLDDASTDDSLTILKEYSTNDHVSHIVINENNTGSPFKQWMTGILLAKGKYVWIAEADDLAEPNFLETCVNLIRSCENVSICYVGSLLIDGDGNLLKGKDVNQWGKRASKNYSCFDGPSFAEHNLYWKNYTINASGILFRCEYAINLSNSAFLKMHYCGDWLFWFQMAMQGKVIEVYKNLNYFRQHGQKATFNSHRSGKGIEEDIQILQYMESCLPKLSTYKKHLRHGMLYRKIKRLSPNKDIARKLHNLLFKTFHSTISDYYLERINQIFRLIHPFLLTRERDRLK